jgi:two-component system, NarL family, response regulator
VKLRNGERGFRCDDGAMDGRGQAAAGLEPIGLAVVDDHPAIAFAIEAAIRAQRTDAAPGQPSGSRPIRLLGVARTPEDGLELVRAVDGPDVVLCDIQLESGSDGLRVVDAARAAGRRAIVLTSFDRSSLMRAAFERGASGFLHKSTSVEDILDAVRRVAEGGTAFSEAGLDAARYAPRPPSDREIAVLREVNRGATSEEIGGTLGISARTVESHLRRLFDRYGVVSRTELAVLAMNEGWVEADPR